MFFFKSQQIDNADFIWISSESIRLPRHFIFLIWSIKFFYFFDPYRFKIPG